MNGPRFTSVTRLSTDVGTLISIAGELDAEAGPEVRRALAMAIVSGGLVEIDLAGVTFADSYGLSALVDVSECAQQYRVDVRVTATTASVQRLLRLTDVPALFGEPVSLPA